MMVPVAARRLVVALLVFAVVLGPNVATLWIATPSASDVQARAIDFTRHYGVVLLGPSDVPSLLAKAGVATEEERFYTHHGIDSIRPPLAPHHEAAHRCLCQGVSSISACSVQ